MSIATDPVARWVTAAILLCVLEGGIRAESTAGQARGERGLPAEQIVFSWFFMRPTFKVNLKK